MLDVPVLR